MTRTAGACLAVVAVAVCGGCARATPGCDRAAADLGAAHLASAAEGYARAGDRGEGDCADAGLKTVGTRYVTAYQNVARGRAAEDGHDHDAAATAYGAALGDDADNTAARDGLARLRPAPPPVAPPGRPAAQPAAPPAPPSTDTPSSPGVGLLVTALALLGAVVVVLAGLLWRTRRRAPVAPDEGPDTVRRIEEILRVEAERRPDWADEQLVALKALQQSLARMVRDADATAAVDGSAVADVRHVVDQHSRRLRRDLVDLVAFLDHRLPGRGPTHDRFGTPAVEPETST